MAIPVTAKRQLTVESDTEIRRMGTMESDTDIRRIDTENYDAIDN